jgi:hypothetical protein
MEKAYDRVNRKKLFEVPEMMHGPEARMLEVLRRVFTDNVVKFVLGIDH